MKRGLIHREKSSGTVLNANILSPERVHHSFISAIISGGSRIFEKGGRGNGKVTLGLLRLNINV